MVLCSIDIRAILFFCHVAIFMLFVLDISLVIVYPLFHQLSFYAFHFFDVGIFVSMLAKQ